MRRRHSCSFFENAAASAETTDRNGRLHVTQHDGSVRGNHPYLSATAVLRQSFTEDAHATAMLARPA